MQPNPNPAAAAAADQIAKHAALQAQYAEYDRKYAKYPGTFDKFHDRTKGTCLLSHLIFLFFNESERSQFFPFNFLTNLPNIMISIKKFTTIIRIIAFKRFKRA